MRPLLVLALGLTSATAHAVPLQIPAQGRLLDFGGVPLDGPETLTFTLYDADDAALWSSDVETTLVGGYYAVVLGRDVPLSPELFDGALWLGIAVDGVEGDRRPVGSAPHALRAGTVDRASGISGGVVDAAELRVGGALVIDGDGRRVAASDPLAVLSCDDGEIVTFDGVGWGCADRTPAHAHDGADLQSGVLSADRLPVGSDDASLAPGAHLHGFDDVVGTLEVGQLPVDFGAQVDGWASDGPLDLDPSSTIGGQDPSFGDHFDAASAVAAMGSSDPGNPLHHGRYTDADAVAAVVGTLPQHPRYTEEDAVAAMGSSAPGNPLHHDRYTGADAVSAVDAAVGPAAPGNPRNHARYDGAVAAMGALADDNPLNHARYTDTDAVAAVADAVGGPSDGNPRHHARYTDADAVAAMGGLDDGNPLHHAPYTDADAVAAVDAAAGAPSPADPTNHARYTDADAVAAMGPETDDNPLNHRPYTDADALDAVFADIGAEGDDNPRNHARYTDPEAVAAMGARGDANPLRHDRFGASEAVAAMGARDDANPLHHDRFTAADAVAAVRAGRGSWRLAHQDDFEDGASGWTDNRTTSCGPGGAMLGGYNTFAGGSVSRTFTGLPAHRELRITLDANFVDSWDGERLYIQVDGAEVWTLSRVFTNEPHRCGSSGWGDTLGVPVELFVRHSGESFTLTVGSTLNQTADDESWGIDDLRIYTR